ncbi:MAG: class I SAM-dependent methyltransferase [Actinobacteria bacterium]|nr:class I SAM-dependent methyltransferase [Actinomycetota bacterium]
MSNLIEITSRIRLKLIVKAYHPWLKKNEKCLDVGCGDGIISEQLLKYFGIKITGCDILSYLTKDIPFIYMKKEDKLPFSNNKYESCLFNDVLHHMSKENQIKLLKEGLRVAKRVLIFEDKPTLAGKAADILANLMRNKNMNIPLTFKDILEWETVFKDLGVKYKSVELPKPFLYPFSHIAFLIYKK